MKMKTTIIFTYCHAMLCQYQKQLHIHTVCDLHQIYIFLNGGLCVICKYTVNFIHINEAAFALYWHFDANYSNSLCARSASLRDTGHAFKARLLIPWMSSTGHARSLPSQSPGLLGRLSTDWNNLSSNLFLNLDMFTRNINKRYFGA